MSRMNSLCIQMDEYQSNSSQQPFYLYREKIRTENWQQMLQGIKEMGSDAIKRQEGWGTCGFRNSQNRPWDLKASKPSLSHLLDGRSKEREGFQTHAMCKRTIMILQQKDQENKTIIEALREKVEAGLKRESQAKYRFSLEIAILQDKVFDLQGTVYDLKQKERFRQQKCEDSCISKSKLLGKIDELQQALTLMNYNFQLLKGAMRAQAMVNRNIQFDEREFQSQIDRTRNHIQKLKTVCDPQKEKVDGLPHVYSFYLDVIKSKDDCQKELSEVDKSNKQIQAPQEPVRQFFARMRDDPTLTQSQREALEKYISRQNQSKESL